MRVDLRGPIDPFVSRHIGPSDDDIRAMLKVIGCDSLDHLVAKAVPARIQSDIAWSHPTPLVEQQVLQHLRQVASSNEVYRSYLGMGYHDTITPPVVLRNVLENPGWYTPYTPYQPEIAQGRLEALLNFQTVVADLTALPIANASLLDEGTAAAEAMGMCFASARGKRTGFFVAADCHPQTIAVVQTRAEAMGVDVLVGDVEAFAADAEAVGKSCGALLQYPTTDGAIPDYQDTVHALRSHGCLVVMATDLLALTLLRPPGELGADIAVGSAQRFGVPMGYGGPHAAFLATHAKFQRQVPGRIVGVSKDCAGRPALRLALQTREQHIRREKATSNICTAQALLAVVAGLYATYHGPDGLKAIAYRVHGMALLLQRAVRALGFSVKHEFVFDTLRLELGSTSSSDVLDLALERKINVRRLGPHAVGMALDETTTLADLEELVVVLRKVAPNPRAEVNLDAWSDGLDVEWPQAKARKTPYMTQPVFHAYHTETEMMRYLRSLEAKDIGLNRSMIPLGSCTMKLNSAVEMIPITWPAFGGLHPFVPLEQALGYQTVVAELEEWLREITGFPGVSLQPNAGSQGELTGLLAIRAYHRDRGDLERTVCLIPSSAHGTNPASAVMAGMKVVVVACDEQGNIDLDDLEQKAQTHSQRLAACMVTYPSTHGVFEDSIQKICQMIHDHGGQVYLDGANLNAMVGLSRPSDLGADVCHLNLHKTFSIPHGGGGPGMGPIAAAAHLEAFLPSHPVVRMGGDKAMGPVAAAPWGSANVLLISLAYMKLMGGKGLRKATQVAILNANYMAKRLEAHYPILYRGEGGFSAHEFIIDLRPLKDQTGVSVDDVAKRLMDYGFHAPTMSWPVAGTMMIEPTESESKVELDRFCDAMIAIHGEIEAIAQGASSPDDNVLKHAPHTAEALAAKDWAHSYSREKAAFPGPWVAANKYWPPVGRIDNAYGDRNLVCSCPSPDDFAEG